MDEPTDGTDMTNFMKNLCEMAGEFAKWSATIDWETLNKKIEYLTNELPQDLENESVRLMNRGWFIWFLDSTLDDFIEKITALANRSECNQDIYMKEYITNNTEVIKANLVTGHPKRKSQIEDAFRAHNLGMYYCSVPTFLAISEGIGRDLYNVGLYAKHKPGTPKARLPVTSDLVDAISGIEIFEAAILKPLKVSSEITRSISAPTNDDKKFLNRHLIMHGNSDAYGNEMNSLKSISLVYFVHKSLNHIKVLSTP